MPEAKTTSPEHESETPTRQTEVFAVYGVEPEIQAYAMARYSRSSLSMKQSLEEISAQKAEKFLNTFYFQYGHRSIADLAHIAMAVERLSLLATVILEDEQRWDGQERSTRYQDFSHPDYHVPDSGEHEDLRTKYRETIDFLFSEYRFFAEEMFRQLAERTPCPADMKEDAYERTIRARAFDIARYLLPLATNTSVGQIVNARTLETQIARLLSHSHPEVRELGGKLKAAAKSPAYNVNGSRLEQLYKDIAAHDEVWAGRVQDLLIKPVLTAPTLVKYAEANPYIIETRRELSLAAAELFDKEPVEPAPAVDLLDDERVEIEIAASLLYEHCQHPYRQVRRKVESLTAARRKEIIDLGTKHRGSHDELLRAFCVGQKFRFDILMDIGGFRDLHRHRRCTQLHQDFVFAHGFETPQDIRDSRHHGRYVATMRRVSEAAHEIATRLQGRTADRTAAQYLIPLAYRKRTLFKMDFAEAVYISELRTAPAGHFSYREIAWKMYEAVAQRHPELAGYFRVHDVRVPVDLLKR